MKKVIQIINSADVSYHVSVNPNNGALTSSKNINEASVFESDWDMSFIPRIKEHIFREHPKVKIKIINV